MARRSSVTARRVIPEQIKPVVHLFLDPRTSYFVPSTRRASTRVCLERRARVTVWALSPFGHLYNRNVNNVTKVPNVASA